MTAGVQAAQGVSIAASGENFSVTVGNSGTFYGFITTGPVGAVSPASFKGITIDAVATDTTVPAYDFSVSLDGGGVLAQTFFRAALVQRTNGTWVRYETSAASFSAGTSTWSWGTGSSPVWSATGTRALILYP